MTWRDLLFAHWPFDPAVVRPLIPAGLELETWDGRAWIGVVPFRMTRVTAHWVPPVPGVSTLGEINVRTYVRRGARSGVWFFSLDATSWAAVHAARLGFALPYHRARIEAVPEGEGVRYRSARQPAGPRFDAEYAPTGRVRTAEPGSLDAWLVNRPRLFAVRGGSRVERTEIDHPQWPLQDAAAEITDNTMLDPLGLRVGSERPHLLFARRVDVVAWPPIGG
jgi:uncharacterized protein